VTRAPTAVLADHSDCSGSATWALQQVIAQDLDYVLFATMADRTAVEAVVAKGLKAGHPFDMDVGGLADEYAGQPVRIKGTIAGVAHIADRHWVSVAFGRGNVVLISEYVTQVMDSLDLTGPCFTEPEQPFLGTVRLGALPYRNVDISKFYPYSDVSCPET
jgi:microcystin degradation protein MlrC